MSTDHQPVPASKWLFWVGWIITVLPALGLIMSAVMKFMKPPEVTDNLAKLGWAESSLLGLAIVELGCLAVYLCPRTALLGAILLTGYLGGATATHVRIGDNFIAPFVVGALVWLGLLLRDERLRALLPWRGDGSVPATGGFLSALAKTLLILVALVGVMVALVAAQPAAYRVTRSATIDAPPSKVFEQVYDFHKWKAWTPWLKADPDAKVTIEGPSGKGAIYKWSGNDDVGEGTMTLTESQPSERIRLKLDFVRPWPGTTDAEFTFKAEGDKTVVTWAIIGERDFQGKAIGLVMDKMIGGKFEEGLASMKSVVESASKK